MNCLELSVIAGGYERKIKRFCRENLPSYIHFTTARKPETAQPGDEETGRLETKRNETKRSETKMRKEWLNVSGCAPERRARVDGGGSKHLEGFYSFICVFRMWSSLESRRKRRTLSDIFRFRPRISLVPERRVQQTGSGPVSRVAELESRATGLQPFRHS